MDGQTLVAVIRNNRNDVEFIARNRQEIVETLDYLRVDCGDVVTIIMRFMSNAELANIYEASHDLINASQNEGYEIPLQIEG